MPPVSKQSNSFISRILKIECPVTVVLAQKQMSLKELTALNAGSILELDKRSDDLLDLVANNCVIARGEAVKIGEFYGIQIRETVPIETAIRSLGKT